MLAPVRNYLFPNDLCSAPLLTAKIQYFTRLDLTTDALWDGDVSFSETRWIVSEDVNVEHLPDVLTSLDTKSDNVWRVCSVDTSYISFALNEFLAPAVSYVHILFVL